MASRPLIRSGAGPLKASAPHTEGLALGLGAAGVGVGVGVGLEIGLGLIHTQLISFPWKDPFPAADTHTVNFT
jgi:hypothetical protein